MVKLQIMKNQMGESKSDFEIFSGLAEKFDLKNRYTDNKTEKEWIRWIYDESNALQETTIGSQTLNLSKKRDGINTQIHSINKYF